MHEFEGLQSAALSLIVTFFLSAVAFHFSLLNYHWPPWSGAESDVAAAAAAAVAVVVVVAAEEASFVRDLDLFAG